MSMPLPNHPGSAPSRHHPLIVAAAVAVLLFCAVGIAAIMGWIPTSIGSNSNLTAADKLAVAPSPLTQQALPSQAAPASRYDVAEQPGQPAPAPVLLAAAAPPKQECRHCGHVESIREITSRAEGSGVGAAGGAVVGGLLGNQVGSGQGRQLATVLGAVGGAVAGNQIEGNMKAHHSYEIKVRLDDGTHRTFNQLSAPNLRSGERVKIVNNALRAAD